MEIGESGNPLLSIPKIIEKNLFLIKKAFNNNVQKFLTIPFLSENVKLTIRFLPKCKKKIFIININKKY